MKQKKTKILYHIKRSCWITLWFVFLTFPFLVIKVDIYQKSIEFRWVNLLYLSISIFLISHVWNYLLSQKRKAGSFSFKRVPLFKNVILKNPIFKHKTFLNIFLSLLFFFFISYPLFVSSYQTSILTTAMIYIILGLGLNIVVGLAGLLDLGYVAFFAVGAYSYGLLNIHFGLGFWAVIPVAMILAGFFGILLGIPVLRLRGDYLAIVTLGFGEIIRLILENWEEFSFGPRGISGIEKAGFWGMDLSYQQYSTYLYYLMFGFCIITILVIQRFQYSKLGRAWVALREDELACQVMGIDTTKTKLTAFGLGACWAGIAGVCFAAKTSYINPPSFTFHESAMILAIVVLGGMGSITGVILAGLILTLFPEYLREIGEYRMLLFGGIMVLMMVFRPKGLIQNTRQKYKIHVSTTEK